MLRILVTLLLTCLLFELCACSKVNSLQPGMYRAEIQLGGGAVPMQLRIDAQQLTAQLWIVEADQQELAKLTVTDKTLHAELPHQLGTLSAQFDRNSLRGELRRATTSNILETFKFAAEREVNYRFVKESSTDNADVSGNWRVQLASVTALVSITQVHDLIDGQMQFKDMACDVTGQTHNEDVYLAAYCKTQLWLFKGKVNQQGELEGDSWCNHQPAQHWLAKHTVDAIDPTEDASRRVTLPWAVPTR